MIVASYVQEIRGQQSLEMLHPYRLVSKMDDRYEIMIAKSGVIHVRRYNVLFLSIYEEQRALQLSRPASLGRPALSIAPWLFISSRHYPVGDHDGEARGRK